MSLPENFMIGVAFMIIGYSQEIVIRIRVSDPINGAPPGMN